MITALFLALALAAPTSLTGVVRDATGAVVPGASIIVKPASGPEQLAVSGADGRFALNSAPDGDVTIVVRAGGFAEFTQRVLPGERERDLTITLQPATLLEAVTVTATRNEQRLGDIPASTNLLTADEIKQSPAVVADDVLRQIPTFSLFRRTSSLSSHPTSQGVSLRGIGPSGVSRTLVLMDGVPFNDPFGGWVYWTRVPLESTDRIEIVDGSSSSLYGNYAMGGVINILPSRATRRTVELKPQYGNHASPKFDFFASDVYGKLGVSVDGSVFDTDGFPIVAPSERGLIDIPATVKFQNYNIKLNYSPSDTVSAFVRAGYFTEDRGNGKVNEVNDTRWKTVSGGLRVQLPDASDLQASVFSDFENFHSTFLAVPATVPPRNIVRLTIDQHVPTKGAGGMLQWSKAIGHANYVTAGTDVRWVDGDSNEDSYNAAPGPVTPPVQEAILALQRVSGGTQRSIGAYAQDILTPLPNLTVTLSARLDHWRNYDGHNLETAVIKGTAVNNKPSLPERSDAVASPRAAARYRFTDWISIWGDAGAGYRAPTLNELYRQFRVGTVLTLANDQLGPERLVGGEAGVNIAPIRNLTVRSTWFDNRVTNPVSNVTIAQAGVNVTQQRQNLGATRIWGIQTDAEYRLRSDWKVAAAYLYNQAKVTDGGATNASLEGNYLPQVPKHRGSIQIAYSNARYATVALGVQYVGRQYDDDQNIRTVPPQALADAGYDVANEPGLPGFTLVDLTVSRTITRNFDAYFGVQNMLDQVYFVGTLPTTIGSPRLINGGIRIRFSAR